MKTSINSKLVLLAHGSPDSNWTLTFENGLDIINGHLEHDACLAYMEMATPSLETVIGIEYLRGHRSFVILPLFFAAGRHLLHDVPAQLEKMRGRFPGIEMKLLEAVGKHDMFWETLGKMIGSDRTRAPAGIKDAG